MILILRRSRIIRITFQLNANTAGLLATYACFCLPSVFFAVLLSALATFSVTAVVCLVLELESTI